MKNKSLIFGIFLSLILFQSAFCQDIEIKGELKDAEESTQIFFQNMLTEEILKTITLESDIFSFTYNLKESGFYRLFIDETVFAILIPLPGEKIEVSIDRENLLNTAIKGSPNSELIYSISIQLQAFEDKAIAQRSAGNYAEANDTDKQKKDYLKKILTDNSSSLATLFFINEYFTIEEEAELFAKVSTDLLKQFPNNEIVKQLSDEVANASRMAIGSEVPEISLSSPDGKTINLSDYRGKYVLIDFWASWCRPCRMESPNFVRMYNKYKSYDFEIFSVSLDRDKASWIKAINDDGLSWVHVSDLKFWNSPYVDKYGVEGIPFTVLIDKEGKVIAKNLRGVELENKLEEILK